MFDFTPKPGNFYMLPAGSRAEELLKPMPQDMLQAAGVGPMTTQAPGEVRACGVGWGGIRLFVHEGWHEGWPGKLFTPCPRGTQLGETAINLVWGRQGPSSLGMHPATSPSSRTVVAVT